MPTLYTHDRNIRLKKYLSKIYREAFLFGFLGLLILIFTGSFLYLYLDI